MQNTCAQNTCTTIVHLVTTPSPPKKIRIDAAALRVLAHPLRSRLLSELRREGPATATALAKVLDTNTGATSYHLRKLADVGLVEETGAGAGRERWWRAAHDMHSWSASDFAGDSDSEAAAEWLEGEYFRQFQRNTEQWAAERSEWPLEWRDAAGASDYMVELTPEQLRAMHREIFEVVERYRAAGPDGPDAARVLFYLHAFPEPRRSGFPESRRTESKR